MNEFQTQMSNIVGSGALRKIQHHTLKQCSDAIEKSYGPKGSNSTIITEVGKTSNGLPMAVTKYTKDGHTILEHLNFIGVMERCIKESLYDMTHSIAHSVGDGTSTTVIMAYIVFEALTKYMDEHPEINPSDLSEHFDDAVQEICEEILKHKKEFTLEDVRDICTISSNNNKKIVEEIYNIYEKYGLDTKISLNTSPSQESFVKGNRGITLRSSYADSSFVNTHDGKCEIQNPRIYVFKDPIYNDRLADIFSAIIETNVIQWVEKAQAERNQKYFANIIPTVILTPEISVDLSGYMQKICTLQGSLPLDGKFPISIVSNISRDDILDDVCKLTGAKGIKRYISEEMMELESKAGVAVTMENLGDAHGTARMVVSDALNTVIVEPSNLYVNYHAEIDKHIEELGRISKFGDSLDINNSEELKEFMITQLGIDPETVKSVSDDVMNLIGIYKEVKAIEAKIKSGEKEFSMEAKALIAFLENKMEAYRRENQITSYHRIKDRLHGILGNLVEYYVGGMSISDREQTKYTVEDCILSCRSAFENGVGRASNVEGMMAAYKLQAKSDMHKIILEAYKTCTLKLYQTAVPEKTAELWLISVLASGFPVDIRTGKPSDKVKSSIMSDVSILNTLSKILTLMVTTNQLIVPDPIMNQYKNIQ
jgi:hypothetical protein